MSIKIKKLSKIIALMLFIMILCITFIYLFAFLTPKLKLNNNGKFYIYDNDNNLVYKGSETSEWVNLKDINENMINAIISIEDKNFYSHKGFNLKRIAYALFSNIKSGHIVAGASTISQQYVKNMYLSFDQTWSRKIEEAYLTIKLEVHYSKDEILEGYLNTINFGQGNYGIASASKYYFNKLPSELTVEESCILAAIPKSPTYLNPVSYYDSSINRAKIVAKSMYDDNYVTKQEYNTLFKNNILIYGKRESNNLNTLMYYQDAVLEELSTIKNIPSSIIKLGGLKIYTELDLNVQSSIENSINNNTKNDNVQVGALYIDPLDGGVRALIGGKDYTSSQYNRVTKSKRQVGSTIKPFLYYAALENGLTMSSKFLSSPTTFTFSKESSYSPSNYNNTYANKDISMAAALAYSDNIYAVKTHLFLGEDTLVNTMKKLGVKEKLSSFPSLALGTIEINMMDYANAYTTLASGGYKRNIHMIKKIEDLEGNTLYEYKKSNKLILNENNVYIINKMLTNTYNTDFIDYVSPTAINISSLLSREYSIKTGTTDEDHWVIGYNPDALLMIWTGTDNNNYESTGYSKLTKNMWAEAMEESLKNKEVSEYNMPPNIVTLLLNPVTGDYISNKYVKYYYVKGTEPFILND